MATWQKQKLEVARANQNSVFDAGVNGLNVAHRQGKQVILTDHRQMTEFVSCSYLGLDQHPTLKEAVISAIDRMGVQFSVARTRMKADTFAELENNLAQITRTDDAVTFNAVTPIHLGVLPLLGSGELPGYRFSNAPFFILDKRAHATMQINRGLLSQFGQVVRIDFDDVNAIQDHFKNASERGLTPISISDSVGSMGGNAPVRELVEFAETFGGYCYLDDAHGTSVFGKNGAGYVHAKLNGRLRPRVILVGSLSKAFGAHGGFIAGESVMADFIRKQAVTYAFGGPPSLPGIAAALASSKLHLSGEVDRLQTVLAQKLKEFDEIMGNDWINSGTPFPIRGYVTGREDLAIKTAKFLHASGVACTAAMYPTVAKGSAMLRFAISVQHESNDFYRLKKTLLSPQYLKITQAGACA